MKLLAYLIVGLAALLLLMPLILFGVGYIVFMWTLLWPYALPVMGGALVVAALLVARKIN